MRTYFANVRAECEVDVLSDIAGHGGLCEVLMHVDGPNGPRSLLAIRGDEDVGDLIKSYRYLGFMG